jgi:hypothetical protein
MRIARQRFGKHIPKVRLSTIEGHPLLGNGPINRYSLQQKTVFSVGSVPRNYKRHSQKNWRNTRSPKEYNGVQWSSSVES